MVLLHQNVVGQVKSCNSSGEFEGIAWQEMSPLDCWVISNVEDVAGSGQTCIIRWRIQVKLSRGLHVTKHCQLVDDCQTSIIRFSNWRRMIRVKSSKGCMWEILHVRNHCLAKYKSSFTGGGTCGDSSLTWATGVSNPLHTCAIVILARFRYTYCMCQRSMKQNWVAEQGSLTTISVNLIYKLNL